MKKAYQIKNGGFDVAISGHRFNNIRVEVNSKLKSPMVKKIAVYASRKVTGLRKGLMLYYSANKNVVVV